ncbi:MAG: replicative DNA helicase [Desulforegulaceae bacterium]|jgi:replicative DNA helicase|nr:replicative DNA helicase [Desulforegulaceae bacterium]
MAKNTDVSKIFEAKIPPQNYEAESSLLATILLDNDTLLDVADIVNPEDFYKNSHSLIYTSMLNLFSNNKPIDLVTLANHLTERGELENAGGKKELASIIELSPIAPNPVDYARIIRDKSHLRRLINSASQIITKCYGEAGTASEILDFAEKKIFEITEKKQRPNFSPLDALIDLNINTLDERQGKDSKITGIPTGYKTLDKITSGLQGSDLLILAARPAMGKTAFALNLARNVAIGSNTPVGIFSLEMSKEQLSMRLLTAEARVDSAKIRGGYLDKDDWERVHSAAAVLYEAPIFIDDSPDVNPLEIRTKARRLKMDKGLGLLIIDYLQLMNAQTKSDRRDLEIAEISRSLKMLAKELNIPVIALSQLNRTLEQRSDKRPMLSDLRESGALEQDADIVSFIYRDEVYNKDENNPNKGLAELIIAKHRNGAVGTVNMAFIDRYTRFEELAHNYS